VGNIIGTARRILGLNSWQEDELFGADAADGEPQTKKHAISGAQGIDEFLKTYESFLKNRTLSYKKNGDIIVPENYEY